MSFYNKDIDGRFRVRCSKDVSNDEASCKVSWKKRLKETTKGLVNKEEEIEVDFNYNQLDNLIFLLENVIHMKKVESYLCREQNIQIYKDVKFGLPMPKVGGDVLWVILKEKLKF